MKRKWIAGWLLSIVLVFSAFPVGPASAAGITYYVATTGSDTNAGTSSGAPFRTIQKAASVMTAGDTCIIAAGTYRETVTPANSGTSGNPITFQAASGAKVVVSGTDQVSGWTVHSGSVYKTTLGWNLGAENQVFINDGTTITPLWEARWPNITDYTFSGLKAGMAVADAGTSGTTIVDAAITQPSGFWNGANVWVRGGHAYLAQGTTVGTQSGTSFNFVSDYPDYLLPEEGDTYYLSGVLGALDMAKEWYVNGSTNTLYLWAPGGASPTNVEVKRRLTAFDLSNKSYINITGLQTFAANIKLNNANNNVLDGITAQYLYFSDDARGYYPSNQNDSGILMAGNNNEIKNSTIAYSSGTLIKIAGSNNRIVNNDIHDGNYMSLYTSLIVMASGSQNLISHNTLRDSGRIIIYWINGNASVQYNNIYNGMWLSRDGGLIYCYGTDMGNSEIHHNLIHDNKAYSTKAAWPASGFNLYLDNFTHNAIVHHNVIYTGDTGIAFNSPGNFKLVYNNTVVGHNIYSFDHWGEAPYDHELYGTRLFNNLLLNTIDAPADIVSGNNISSSTGVNFVNAAGNNYRLATGSTAIDAGVVINGITGGFTGASPDAGAYEYNGTDWTAGHNFASPPNPAPAYTPVNTPYMNLLTNGTFEVGTTGWVTGTPAAVTTVPVSSSPAWAYRGVSDKLRLGGGVVGVEQTVTGLTPNTGYKFVGWVHSDSGETVNVGAKSYGGAEVSASSSDTSYVRREVNFTTGPANTSAVVYIYKSSAGAGYSYGDDFGLIQTSAPSSDTQAPTAPANLTSPSKTDTTVTLSWTASTDNVGVAAYDIYRGATLAGSTGGATTFTATGLTGSTAYSFTVKARDAAGNASAASAALNVTTNASTLPSPWLTQDIGSVGVAGSGSYSSGTFTVNGSGSDIWGTADSFRYVYQPLNGDGQIVARVATVQNTDGNAKAGVMIRESLAADAKQVLTNVTPTNGSQWIYRAATAGVSNYALGVNVTAPYWVKLVRTGSTFTGYTSPDGVTWTQISTQSIPMTTGVYIGLAVVSKVNTTLNTSTFDNVTVSSSSADTQAPTAPANLVTTGKTDTTVSLSWTASTDNVGVTGYDVYRGTTLAGSTAGATTFTATGLTPNTAYSFTVKARDAANNVSAASNVVSVTTNPLPNPWLTQDIGSVGVAGSASYSGGTYTVNGSGSDIYGTADSFRFVYQTMNGDGQIVARVASMTNPDSNAKAGVMIRETLAAGSKHALMDITPGNIVPGGQTQYMYRTATDGTTSYALSSGVPPYWMKLVRTGSTIVGSISADGVTWTQISSQTITMAADVYVGLAVLSHNNTALCTSTFDNVTVTP